MKSKAAKKPVDEDEAKSKKIRSSRGKRRRGRHSRSRSPSSSDSGSESPPRKRSKKSTKKVAEKKSKKHKGSSTIRRRRRSPSPSPSPSPSSSSSSVSRSRSHSRRSRHSSISASERSVSPLPRSHSKDTRKGKGKERGRGRDKDRRRRRARRSMSYSSSPASSGSSQSRSKSKRRKRRVGATRDDATGDRIVQDYDNHLASRTVRNSIEGVDRDAIDFATKGIDDYEKNVALERKESSPSKDSQEMGEILSPKNANATDEILPLCGGSPEVEEDLELTLRQKALENFRKFKEAAVVPGNTDSNGTGKGVLTDSVWNTSTKIAEARSAVTPSQMQGNSFGVGHSAGSPELEDFGNGTSPWNQEMSRGDRSPGIPDASDTSAPTQQQGSRLELIRPASRIMPRDGRNGGSVMQRLGNNPPSSATVKQRLGSSAGVIPVQATRRVRSVVSIPAREGLDGSEFTTTPSACENPVPVESSSEARHPPVDINNNLEETNGDDRKTGEEASAPDSFLLSASEGKSQGGTEDKDGSQFEKRTFSRMHDGETVQVSYKVYIPTTSPRLARRKLQR